MYKYDLVFTKQFQKDLDLAKKQHIDLTKLFEVIDKLRNDEQLDPVYRDHELSGKHYSGKRECHVLNDFLLVYIKDGKSLILLLYRCGSHSHLF